LWKYTSQGSKSRERHPGVAHKLQSKELPGGKKSGGDVLRNIPRPPSEGGKILPNVESAGIRWRGRRHVGEGRPPYSEQKKNVGLPNQENEEN